MIKVLTQLVRDVGWSTYFSQLKIVQDVEEYVYIIIERRMAYIYATYELTGTNHMMKSGVHKR